MLIKRERLPVVITARAEMALWDDLRQDFQGFVHEVKSQYWKSFHLPFVESGERLPGEVFFAEPDAILYYTIDPQRQWLEAGCFLPHGDGLQAFQGFCERLKENVLPGYKDRPPHWTPHTDSNSTFDLVREEAQRLSASPDQLAAAASLADAGRRKMLRTILQERSALVENLTNGRSAMEVGQEVQLLEGLGLIQKEFVVFCRENNTQITRVNHVQMIEEATQRGFKCFSCGRPIAQERIDQLLACTPAGRELARPNHWLALVLSSSLEQLGVERPDTLVVPAGRQGVLDLFANQDGTLIMFEIREEGVHLDDIFLFFARIRYYRPDLAFYLTTGSVSDEVRKYFDQGATVPVTLMESAAHLEEQVKQVVERSQRERLRSIVNRLEPLTAVDVDNLVYEFFFGKEERVAEVIVEPVREAPPSDSPEETAVEEIVAAAAASEVIDATGMGPGLLEEPPPESGSTASGEPPGGEGLLTIPEEVLEVPSIVEMQEVLEMEEPLPVERPLDERREQAIRKAVDEIGAGPLAGRWAAIETALNELAALPNLGAALADDSGLLLVDRLSERIDGELTTALAVETHDTIQRGLEEAGFARATQIQVDSQADRLFLRPTAAGTLLVVREERPPREVDEESASTLPGEMVLREAMLKKVLEDLSMVEGIQGNLVAGRDGLLIEAMLDSEEAPPDVLSVILSLMVVDNERNLQRLQLLPMRQLLVRNPDVLFSLIPLDKEGILISLLDPATPREVWQNRLYAAANMLTSVFQ